MSDSPPSVEPRPHLLGDSAKRTLVDDCFGLSEFAKALSEVVRSRAAQDGYAIGIEGPWGCGKSTLLNFVEEILTNKSVIHQQVIRFEPWLIGKKESLLREFFGQLITAIQDLRSELEANGQLSLEQTSAFDALVVHIAQYSKYLDIAADGTALLAKFDHTGHGALIAGFIKFLAWIAKLFDKPLPSVEALKDQIVSDLRTIAYSVSKARITVLVDDTDRLDPDESVEILRLIKAVANFPLVTYLVCFDRTILAAQVKQAVKVDGEEYLEKIFQQIVPIPPQEPFALRTFVLQQLAHAFPTEMKPPAAGEFDLEDRRQIVFDKWAGKFIETPRDAIRLCDAIKFGWPHLSGKVDFLDFVWLQLIKLKCQPLYAWTQNYVSNLGSYRDGGRAGDDEPSAEAVKLRAIVQFLGWLPDPDRSGLAQMLPGLSKFSLEGSKAVVFSFDPTNELAKYETGRRLGSPSHWRFFFAFAKPSYALDDVELTDFLTTISTDWQTGSVFLRRLLDRDHRNRGHYLDVLLDRLKDAQAPFTADQQIGMARAFADMMDEVPRRPDAQFGGLDAWRIATRLLGKAAGPHFADIVRGARSVNWLAMVMRDQGFALGGVNPNQVATERQWLTREEFDHALVQTLRRFQEMGIDAIFDAPEPIQILWCWEMLGDADALRAEIAKAIVDDVVFIKALNAMRGWVSSSNRGLYQGLDGSTVGRLTDGPAARQRLEQLRDDPKTSAEMRQPVMDLLSSWNDH